MSLIALTLNLLLAGLLIAALVMGVRLDAKLKALRASHEGFAKAVADLDAAAGRAEQALAQLRSGTDEAAVVLGERIDRARALASKLDERLARPVPTDGEARLKALSERIEAATGVDSAPTPSVRSRVAIDDDLFEGVTLKALVGGRR